MSTPKSLTQQASRGAAWSLISNVTVSAISFVGTAILARMLEPKDFGLMGMAVLVTGIVGLFGNFGLGAALVQRKDITDEDLSTAFWANCAAGLTLAIVCVIVSPFAALFFGEPAVQWVLILLSFNFILSALSSVHSTLVYRRIQMKPLAAIEVGSRILRVGVMLVAAFLGMTFWSIVIGMLVERIFKVIGFMFIDPWRPSLVFSVHKFKEMFKFGRNILGGGFLGYLNNNMDFIVTGRVLGAGLLGFYQMSYNLPHLIKDYISDSIGAVSFPVFCKVQDDNERLFHGFSKIIRYISLITFPILSGLILTAHDFIFVVYGERWLPAVAPLKVLCFSAALASINTVVVPLLNAKGRPDLCLKWGLVRLPATITAILLGVHFGGIKGAAWGMAVVEVLSLAMVYHMVKVIKANFNDYWRALYPAAMASCVMAVLLACVNIFLGLNDLAPLIRLLSDFFLGALIYVFTVIVLFKDVFRDFLLFAKRTMGQSS